MRITIISASHIIHTKGITFNTTIVSATTSIYLHQHHTLTITNTIHHHRYQNKNNNVHLDPLSLIKSNNIKMNNVEELIVTNHNKSISLNIETKIIIMREGCKHKQILTLLVESNTPLVESNTPLVESNSLSNRGK